MLNELTLIAEATRVLVYHVFVNVRYWFFIACIVSTPVHCILWATPNHSLRSCLLNGRKGISTTKMMVAS